MGSKDRVSYGRDLSCRLCLLSKVLLESQLILHQIGHVIETFFGPSMFFIKVTLFLFYMEIFSRLRWLRYLGWLGIVFTGMCSVASMVGFLVICTPRTGQGQLDYMAVVFSPQCGRSPLVLTLQAVVNLVSDLYLLILPLPAIWNLHLPTRKKLGIAAIISTGIG